MNLNRIGSSVDSSTVVQTTPQSSSLRALALVAAFATAVASACGSGAGTQEAGGTTTGTGGMGGSGSMVDGGTGVNTVDSGTCDVKGTINDIATSTVPAVVVGDPSNQLELARWGFTATGGDAIIENLQIGSDTKGSLSSLYLYSGSTCSTPVGNTTGYIPDANGTFDVTNLNTTIPNGTNLTVCAKAIVNQVGNASQDGSNIGVGLLNVSKIIDGQGVNVSDCFQGTFPLNGPVNVLRASYPVVTINATPNGQFALPQAGTNGTVHNTPTTGTTVLSFNVAALLVKMMWFSIKATKLPLR